MPGRTLATAFVELRPDGNRLGPELKSQTEKAGADAGTNAGHHFGETMKKAIKAAGIALALGAALVGVKALGFIKQAELDASDLNETVSKAQNVFPATTAALNKFASTSAAALGLSRQQALDGAASFGQFFNQIGIGEKQSLKMSTALLKLSADLGSFNNADPSEVMDAFLSATRGEYDALQRFLPTINAATIQTEALRLTHKKSTKDLTDADKALALYQLSLKGVGKAQNDFAETAAGQANATRTWQANLADIRAEIGQALMPVMVTLVNALNSQLVPLIKDLWAKHGPAVVGFFDRVVVGMEAFVAALNTGEAEGTGFAGFMSRLAVAGQNLGPTLRNVVASVREWFAAQNAGSGGESLGQRFSDISDSAKKLLPLVKEFIDDLPSLSDVVDVAGTVLGFLADHTDELKTLMPLLVTAVIAYKVAQLAANVAAAASPVFRIADAVATRQQTAAIRAQTAALTASKGVTAAATVTQAAETGAQNVGLLTRLRATAAMIAQRVAMAAVRGATIAWTAVQWLLNAALTANPIGIVIVAIAALVAGIIYAYNHSETFRKIVQAAWKGVQVAIKFVVDWFVNTAWPWLKKAWDGIVQGVKVAIALWKGYMDLIRSVVQAVFKWIGDFIRDRIEFVKSVIRRVQEIVAIFKDAFGRANKAILEKIENAVAFVKALPGRILSALGNLGSKLYQSGRDLVQGMINGISDMIGRLIEKVKGMISSIPGAVKKILGISSPSKVFAQLGRQTIEGYIAGLGQAGSVEDAITRAIGAPALRVTATAEVDRFATGRGAGAGAGGVTVENLNVQAFSDRFSLRQIEDELALNGAH